MIVAVFEGTDMSPMQYDQVIADLRDAGLGRPEGRIHHTVGWMADGFVMVDTWVDESTLQRFEHELLPILERNGVEQPPPHIYELYNQIV